MGQVLDELVTLLSLEKIEDNLFRGQSQDLGWGSVFGGQVLGQALSAAAQTTPAGRDVHSLHAYFLRRGDVEKPIVYDVDRIRDGTSFTTRRVVAIQGGRGPSSTWPPRSTRWSKAAEQPGPDARRPRPPRTVPTDQERLARAAASSGLPAALLERWTGERAFEMRTVGEDEDLFHPAPAPPRRCLWLKTTGVLADDPALHRYLLAYASDHGFLATALRPHGLSLFGGRIQMASLDHVMWFHAPLRADEWLLHVIDSPRAGGSRALVRGQVFTRDGRLVASTAQEGLVRQRDGKKST